MIRGDGRQRAILSTGMPTNVDVVRRALDAFNSGDLEAMLAMQDPEFEWRPAFGGAMLGASVYRGPAAFREYWRDVQEIWNHTFRFDPENFSDHGNTVVVVGRGRGRARGSAIDIDQPFAMLFKVGRGKLVFGQTFADPNEALEAARADPVSRSEQPT
jgi:ketosteroid isomerase-like protein